MTALRCHPGRVYAHAGDFLVCVHADSEGATFVDDTGRDLWLTTGALRGLTEVAAGEQRDAAIENAVPGLWARRSYTRAPGRRAS